jgi:hypothetical protein
MSTPVRQLVTEGLLVILEANPGREEEVAGFPDSAREAHLSGKVAAALMGRAEELFSETPNIQKLDVLAAKLPVPDID